ncbi:PfkB family carbohydrate kinase [Arthrobacter sp. 2RAF6]|uniref:PfkB family carbohydrate kinase n=1 Tax=Arthrobacter sp. 2RAF6 TaxID=3233002 RepID=UPI003F8EC043
MVVRLCGLGDNVVDRYVDQGLMYPGGNAVNVAVHARRSGAVTAFVGVIGTDDEGDLVESSLLSEGVRIDRVRRAEGETAFATVYTDETGNRSFGLCEKGVSIFTPDDADLDYLAGFDIVHLCETIRMEAALPAIASRTAVSYDFSDRDNAYAKPLLPSVTVATFSRPESTPAEVEAQIAWAHAQGASWVIVTRGARGAAISNGERIHYQEAAPAQVVDTLGAGDSFIARLVVRLWEGVGLTEAAGEAAFYSAEVCGVPGGYGYGRSLVPPTAGSALAELTNEGRQ